MKKIMLVKEDCFSSGKKLLLLAFFFTIVVTASFGQVIWTTVQDNNYKVIPIATAKAEILKLCDLYQWFYTSEPFSRSLFTAFVSMTVENTNNPIERRYNNDLLRWLNTYRFSIHSYQSPEINSVSIIIINGNNVYMPSIANINPVGIGISTRNKQRIGQIIDEMLK